MEFFLETERMYLREFILEDALHLYALNSDSEVLKYTGDKAFENEEAARNFILNYVYSPPDKLGRWACFLKHNFDFVNWCGLRRLTETNEVDLGYRILKKFWNQGCATEAGKSCLHYGFTQKNLAKIIGRTQINNQASIKVLQKLGMNFCGHFEFDLHPGSKYQLTKSQYQSALI